METKTSARIAFPVVAIALLLLLALIGSIVSLGNQLSSIHLVLGIAYYAAILVLIVIGVAYPIARTIGHPIVCLYELKTGSGRKREKHLRLTIESLQRADLPPDTKARLAERPDDIAADECIALFKSTLEPAIDRRIKDAAKASFVTTSISQAPAFDMISIMAIDFRMIRGIVEDCGYRPSTPALLWLYVRSMKATLIAGGLEEMDLEEIVALIGGNAALTASSVVLSSAAQGAANAFLTVRVGVITKALLFSENAPADMRELRRKSYGEALKFLRECGLLDDLRQAMTSAAGAARDAAVAKVADMKDAAVSKATGMRDAATRQIADLYDDATERIAEIKEATAERMAGLKGDMTKKTPVERGNSPKQSQPGYTVAMPKGRRND